MTATVNTIKNSAQIKSQCQFKDAEGRDLAPSGFGRTDTCPEAPFRKVEIVLLYCTIGLREHRILEGGVVILEETFIVAVVDGPVGVVRDRAPRHDEICFYILDTNQRELLSYPDVHSKRNAPPELLLSTSLVKQTTERAAPTREQLAGQYWSTMSKGR